MKTLLLLATILSSQAFAYDLGGDMDHDLTEGKIIAAMEATEAQYDIERDITEGKIIAAMKIMVEQKREDVVDSLRLLDIIINTLVEYDQERANAVISEVAIINAQLELLVDDEDDATIGGLNDAITKLNAIIADLSDVNIY